MQYTSDEFKTLASYTLFNEHFRPMLLAKNPKKITYKMDSVVGAKWREFKELREQRQQNTRAEELQQLISNEEVSKGSTSDQSLQAYVNASERSAPTVEAHVLRLITIFASNVPPKKMSTSARANSSASQSLVGEMAESATNTPRLTPASGAASPKKRKKALPTSSIPKLAAVPQLIHGFPKPMATVEAASSVTALPPAVTTAAAADSS